MSGWFFRVRVAARRSGCLAASSTDMYSSNSLASGDDELWSVSPLIVICRWREFRIRVEEIAERNGFAPGIAKEDEWDGATKPLAKDADDNARASAAMADAGEGRWRILILSNWDRREERRKKARVSKSNHLRVYIEDCRAHVAESIKRWEVKRFLPPQAESVVSVHLAPCKICFTPRRTIDVCLFEDALEMLESRRGEGRWHEFAYLWG